MSDDTLHWLALNDKRGILPHYLLDYVISNFDSLKNFWDLTQKELLNLRFKRDDVEKFNTFKQKINLENYKPDLNYVNKNKIKIIKYVDNEYPKILKRSSIETLEPPVLLFRKGIKIDFIKSAALVGTRKASRSSRAKTREFSSFLAEKKYWIISGMANGIDTEAHRGALRVKNGKTIAVLPWMDPITPLSNEYLSEEIMKNGCLISEKLKQPKKGSLKYPYIERNRITSGLSDFLIAVESGSTGGTIRQVDLAVSQNKPVYTFYPAKDIEKDKIEGFNILVQKGSKPINSISEITEFTANQTNNLHNKLRKTSEFRLSYGHTKEDALSRLSSFSEFDFPIEEVEIIELANQKVDLKSFTQKYYLIRSPIIFERPNCPRCGSDKIISRGNQWHCKSCGRYFTKKLKQKSIEEHKQTTLSKK